MTKARTDGDGKLELLRGETWKYQDCPYIQYHPDVASPSYYYCGDSCPSFEVKEKERREALFVNRNRQGIESEVRPEVASKAVKYLVVHMHCCGAEYEMEVKE